LAHASLVGNSAKGTYRVLVVDDDPAIARLVKDTLEGAGYRVLVANSGRHALDIIAQYGLPHLAIVDIYMPGMNGFEFCQAVQEYADLPVIMLSAIDEEETIIQGINRFAEDYVVKPFSARELAARVQRVLRRLGDYAYASDPIIHVDDDLDIDIAHQQALVKGRVVSLTPTETKLLYILMCNAGHAVSMDFLLRRLWPTDEVYEETLRVNVHRLRQKIEPMPSRPRYVLTERGQGYSFPGRT
jgi:DNA-binding response OmpR family regulator